MSGQPWDDTPWDDDEPQAQVEGEIVAEVEGEIVDSDALALHETVATSVDITTPLTMDEARELTDRIRSTADVLYVLIARAHAGKAWVALGYSSFEAYVREEFDISRSRAYQILDQAKVIQAIEAATPDGTELSISEAAARDLKSVIGEVVPEIEQRTRDLPANEAAEVVEEIVEEYRERKREAREQAEQQYEDWAADRAERAGFSEGGGNGTYTPPPPPVFDEEDDIDPAEIRRNVQAAYDLYSSMSALKSMPPIQAVIDTIPPERRVQINDSLPAAVQFLTEFKDTWFAQPWQNGGDENVTDPSDAGVEFDEYDEDFGEEPEV